MSGRGKLVHIGMTVENIERTYEFYHEYFGFEMIFIDEFDEEYIGAYNYIFNVPEHTVCRFAFMRDYMGTCFELFQFSSKAPRELPPWNKPGIHHLCIEVDDVLEKYKEMSSKGIVFRDPPRARPRQAAGKIKYLAFLLDPDENYIELHDRQ